MPQNAPPTIFAPARRLARYRRARALQRRPNAARFVIDDMVEDVLERLAFVRLQPKRALVIGDWTGALAQQLASTASEVTQLLPDQLDEERPYPVGDFDLVVSMGTLDTVNDLPGALIHLRHALSPGGLMIASLMGAGSLPVLRRIMQAADAERPAARIHPLVDVRGGGQLLQRTGWADPVVDSRSIRASYRSLGRLVADLREQGLGNVLASPGPAFNKAALSRADAAFTDLCEGGRLTELFEILTLSGRSSKQSSSLR